MPEPSIDLSIYDQTTLARWWCDLNCWEWPDDFPMPEPPGWHAMSNKEKYVHPRGREAWAALNHFADKNFISAEWLLQVDPDGAIRAKLKNI